MGQSFQKFDHFSAFQYWLLLELFLSPDNVEKLHDFEEECMEDLFRKRRQGLHDSEEKLIELTVEKYVLLSL